MAVREFWEGSMRKLGLVGEGRFPFKQIGSFPRSQRRRYSSTDPPCGTSHEEGPMGTKQGGSGKELPLPEAAEMQQGKKQE
eukprot:16432811-Heterocapsa_arctica.AAC.1